MLSRARGRDENVHSTRENGDRHVSRAREADVVCKRETNPHRLALDIVFFIADTIRA